MIRWEESVVKDRDNIFVSGFRYLMTINYEFSNELNFTRKRNEDIHHVHVFS